MSNKIVYKKKSLLGSKAHKSSAMKDILEKDSEKHVVNKSIEKKQLFNELKKYRNGGVTEREMKSALAALKYGNDNNFSKREIDILAKELGLKSVQKKHFPSKIVSHTSKLDKAHHSANFSRTRNGARTSGDNRNMHSDDVVNFELLRAVRGVVGVSKKVVSTGNMAFDKSEEEYELFDEKLGRRYNIRTSKLTRPDLHMKGQASFRGRGLVKGA
ncbi:MAG: hypothetical protein ACKUBY_04570 [Candidatus Moraniibacteriota bacterium]|jgi:hypothetical protein